MKSRLPPPSVPSLDVETLKTHAVQCREEGRPQDWWLFKAMTPEGKVSNGQTVDVEACVRLLKDIASIYAAGAALAASSSTRRPPLARPSPRRRAPMKDEVKT